MTGSVRGHADSTPGRRDQPAPTALLRDEQSLLAAAVSRLGESTGCGLVAAWATRPDGAPYVAAASFAESAPPSPDRAAFDAAAELPGATRLADPGAPRELTRRFPDDPAAYAVAPVRGSDGAVHAVLLLGTRLPDEPRPRTLAALDAAARRLAIPLAGARAMRRLTALDDEASRLDRLAVLGALTVEIAHEVRNPLVSVKTFLQLLPERRDDPEFLNGFLEVAQGELQRVERLLDALIAHPRQPSPERGASAADALSAVALLLGHLSRARGVELEAQGGAGLPQLAVSPDALRQLLLNLALNAVEATPAGGRVQLSARGEAAGVELVVTDEGPGVPEEERERIFDPFHSTRAGHHGGLGLAIARRIAQEAGGRIRIEDTETGGAAFRVWLPVL